MLGQVVDVGVEEGQHACRVGSPGTERRRSGEQQHLPGAIALTEGHVEEKASELLPDKGAAIVVYCSNAACGNSQAVATRLERLGYTGVRKYREGIQDWVEAGLPVKTGA
ncbi:rhodanese-like domain-containing protein [Saccharopolyspora elongata]|uniref:Rhodanese-like domain-containing protein n=1 Tax=Saccharopolyspora elongata TaxID=2530387 RepID=A0A4V2YKA9_9PSEU|nr:rhodanese-like domain-containing protein [Saccharopolyspora elongata]TDD41717.1 rhodanese-like domain-containing protein [Saccharopolyspora elongata]